MERDADTARRSSVERRTCFEWFLFQPPSALGVSPSRVPSPGSVVSQCAAVCKFFPPIRQVESSSARCCGSRAPPQHSHAHAAEDDMSASAVCHQLRAPVGARQIRRASGRAARVARVRVPDRLARSIRRVIVFGRESVAARLRLTRPAPTPRSSS